MYLSSLRHNAEMTVQTAVGPAEQQKAATDASISISETVPNPGAVLWRGNQPFGMWSFGRFVISQPETGEGKGRKHMRCTIMHECLLHMTMHFYYGIAHMKRVVTKCNCRFSTDAYRQWKHLFPKIHCIAVCP